MCLGASSRCRSALPLKASWARLLTGKRPYAVGVAVAFLVGVASLAVVAYTLPGVDRLAADNHYAKQLAIRSLGWERANEHVWVTLEQVPLVAICAILFTEDRSFFVHRGVDWTETWLAIRQAPGRILRGERLRGASTIAQQLARTLYLSPRRSPDRKVREWMLARRIDLTLGKPRTLELYLNTSRWSGTGAGLAAATQEYFGHDVARITPFEASVLASVLQAPTKSFYGRELFRRSSLQWRILLQLRSAQVIDSAEAYAGLVAVHAFNSELRNDGSLAEAMTQARLMERLGTREIGYPEIVQPATIAARCKLNEASHTTAAPKTP